MKYITSVKNGTQIKHIIEICGKNVEVVEYAFGGYGEEKEDLAFWYESIRVCKKTFSFKGDSNNSKMHLATVVLAIEIAKFIVEATKSNS